MWRGWFRIGTVCGWLWGGNIDPWILGRHLENIEFNDEDDGV